MKKPVVTGILSYGMSGKVFHAPFIHAHSGFQLYAITERTKKEARVRYPDIRSYDSVDELISDPAIELVIVNTPNNTHFEYARKALIAGKHVLVEKPFASSVEEAQELFALASEKGLYALVYQNRRWDSDFLSVREVIESGVLGKLIEVHFRFDRYKNIISPKTFKEINIPGAGLSYDLGPHLLDQILSLFGRPLRSTKRTSINRTNSLVDDYSTFHLIYPDGPNVFVTASLLTAAPLPAFVIHGSNGTYIKERADVQEEQLLKQITPDEEIYGLEEPAKKGRLTVAKSEGGVELREIDNKNGAYMQLFEALFNQLRNNIPFPVTTEQVIWQMELLQQEEL